MQQAQAGREIRLAYQEAVKEDGHVLGDEAARQLKEDLQTLGVAKETARTVLQGVDMPNAWASDGLRTAMESVYETARGEAARVEARAARTEAAELKSSQRLGTLMEKFTAAQEKANAARAQNDLKGYLAAVEDMRGAVLNYQNALAVEEKAGEARQIETQEQTRKATAATEQAVAAAQPAVQEGYARVAAEIAAQRAAAQQFGAQQAAGQAQDAAGQAEAGQMAAGTFAPDPALPNSGFPVSIAQYDDDTKRQIVRAFAAYEMSGVDTADRIVLGVVPEQLATDVERIAQIDIHGFDNVLQADGLRHGAKHDGRTGNKPVTPEDVAALLDIFDTYNNITVTSKRGETSIKLSKTGADGMTYVAVIGKKKGHIFTKNMWKGQTKGDGSFRRTDAHNAPASTPAAAANYEPSTDSLPENVQDGKGTTGFLPSTADATGRPQAQAREPMRANRADAAATPQGTAGVDVMDELVRGAGTAVSAQETEGTGARARSAMEAAMDGTEEPGARPAGQGKRRYRAGVNRADTAVRLDAADRMQLRVLDGLGKKYGVKIVIEDTIRYEDGEGRVYAGTSNGYYDRSDGTIHVALDAEGGAYLFFGVHELTHKLRAENADAYAALEAFVLNKLETSKLYGALTQGEGGTLEERIASVQALYAARGQELSRGEALEELVCDAIPVILTDEQAVRELVRTDRTLAERIRDFFEEFYHELTRQLAGVVYGPGNRVEAAALMNDAETVRELAELFKTALESSADLQYELLTQSGSAIEEAGNDKRRGRRLSARADGEETITMEDVAAIQSIGRKSVNDFTSDEIRTAEPFARRYWRELGVKSPFFRAWFGDWRANDRTPVRPVRVAGADAPKSGRAINADTGRPISWGDRLRSETWAHGTKNALESIKGIDRIIETAVLLDTVAANPTGKSKLPGTAFMHSLYSLADDGSGLTLYRLFAEEAVPARGGEPFTRAYELKEIKKVATAPYGVLSVSGGLTNGAPATTYTIADLFAFVKENVPDFQPKPVHPALLNEEGTPKVFYHGTGSEFYEFSTEQIGAREGSFFFAENPEDAAGYGRNVMPVYLSAENLADYDAQPSEFYRLENKRAQVAYLKERGYDGWYADMDSDGWGEISVFSPEQIKSATDNAGTFDRRNQNIRFSQKAGEGTESAPGRIYDYSKPFAEQVDDWMAGQTPQYDTLLIGRTPLLYRQIGLSDVPMTIDQTHLDYMVNGTKNENHHLGVELVRQLPELLEHPVAVIESATRPDDSVMAIVRGKVNGRQLVAAVRIGGNGVLNDLVIDANHIVSAQGRGNAVTKLLNDALQKELRGEAGVYYWNKEEALPLTVRAGVQFPGGRINDGLVHSIFDAASPVNRNYLEQTETRQFKRWFAAALSPLTSIAGLPEVNLQIRVHFRVRSVPGNAYFGSI